MSLPERSLQRYTQQEDQRILDDWWQPHLRPALLNDLGRSKAAVAQRFYFLLRALQLTPAEFRRAKQRGQRITPPSLPYPDAVEEADPRAEPEAASPAPPQVVEAWTPERDAFLLRQVRAGVSYEEIADVLGGVTPAVCRSRYYEIVPDASGSAMESGHAASGVAQGAIQPPPPAEAGRAGWPVAASRQGGEEVLTLLRRLPDEQRQLEEEQRRLAARLDELTQRVETLGAGLAELRTPTGPTLPGPARPTAGDERGARLEELLATIRDYLQLDPWEKVGHLGEFISQLEKEMPCFPPPP